MKKTGIILLVCVFLAGSANIMAQKIKIKKGSLDFLKGTEVLNVTFDYSGMGVGKFDNEEDYIEKKRKDYNEDEPGKGDRWAEHWVNDREKSYEPKFMELCNAYLEKADIDAKKDHPEAEYTMIVHTVFTEPGFNVGIARKNAEIDAEVSIVKTSAPDDVKAFITVKKSPGRSFGGGDFDTELRISEAYAKMGKELGKLIYKKTK
ncbi:MAG: hypothetical protein R6T99_02285 [Bacteroidales bacterium]